MAEYLTGGSTPLPDENLDQVGGGLGLNAYLIDISTHLVDYDNPHKTSFGQLSDVDLTNLMVDGVPTWNGANWIVRLPSAVAAAGTNRWWMTSPNADIGQNQVLSPIPDQDQEEHIDVQVAGETPVFIGSWITNAGYPHRAVIDRGTWDSTVYLASDSEIILNQKVILYKVDGTTEVIQDENLTVAATYTPGEAPVFSRERFTSAQNTEIATGLDDRIQVAYYVSALGIPANPINVSISYAGTNQASSIIVPYVVQHNELAGLEGGDGEHYYHMTQEQYNEFLGEFAVNNLRYLGIGTDVWNFEWSHSRITSSASCKINRFIFTSSVL